MIAADPGDTPALERLIHVAERAGQRERAAELVKQQAEAAHRRSVRGSLRPLATDPRRRRDGRAGPGAGPPLRGARLPDARALGSAKRADLRRDLERLNRSSATVLKAQQSLAELIAREWGNLGKIETRPVP